MTCLTWHQHLDDVLTDVRRITDASSSPLLVDADTGFGGAFNIARTVKSLIKFGAGAMPSKTRVKRCGHRPGKKRAREMVDRVKAAAEARNDAGFVIRPHRRRGQRLQAAIDRACACVEAGADMIFPEASPSSPCTRNSSTR